MQVDSEPYERVNASSTALPRCQQSAELSRELDVKHHLPSTAPPRGKMSAPAAAPGAVPTGMGPAPTNNLVAQTVLGSLMARFKETSASVLKEQKPWSEVLDRTVFSKPENMGEVRLASG
jgi:hypothetical protein